MPHKKCRTNNPAGRPKGSPNKVTRALRPLLQEFLQGEIEILPKLIDQLEPRDRVQLVTKLLEFVVAKATPETESTQQNVHTSFGISDFAAKMLQADLEWREKKLAEAGQDRPLNAQ